MRRLIAILPLCLCALLLPVSVANPAGTPVRNFTIHYNFSHKSLLLARMVRTLRANGDGTYTLESRSEAVGIAALLLNDNITEHSVWDLADGRPRSLHYEYHHSGRKKGDRHAVLDFDWRKGIVTNKINDDPWTMRVPTGTQDKLLYQYTLSRDLQQGTQIPAYAYDVADGGELKSFRFERLGTEEIDTPIGRLQTVKLQRVHGSRRTVIWCAATLDYNPVRIEQHKDGKVLTMEIRKIEGIEIKD